MSSGKPSPISHALSFEKITFDAMSKLISNTSIKNNGAIISNQHGNKNKNENKKEKSQDNGNTHTNLQNGYPSSGVWNKGSFAYKNIINNTRGVLNGNVNDTELISMLTKRVTLLEEEAKERQIEEKNREQVWLCIGLRNMQDLRMLDAKCKLYEQNLSRVDKDVVHNLQSENLRLKKQIAEMEAFLNDYGLVWVGFRDEDPNELSDLAWFEMKMMMASILELNQSMAEPPQPSIVNENGVHMFKRERTAEEQLIFFQNGIFFKNGPLRLYSLPDTRVCNFSIQSSS